MSPILVRPVREQLEHDRVIRLLQTKYRRRYDVAINPGTELNAGVGTGTSTVYPDLVLSSQERGHRLQGVVEVETGESVNHLEALAQWGHYARTRAAFHLYVPASMVDVARRLCEDSQIQVSEIWSFHTIGDQVRFTMVHRSREVPAPAPRVRAVSKPSPAPHVRAVAKPVPAPRARAVAKPAARSKPVRSVKAASRSKSQKKKPAHVQRRK